MSVGGSIQKVSLAGSTFNATADNEATLMLGGKSNEVRPNGDGVTGRTVKTVVPWKISGLELAVDFAAGEMEFLQNLADGPPFACAITLADGKVFRGTGSIQGDLTGNTQNSTASMELSGSGKLS